MLSNNKNTFSVIKNRKPRFSLRKLSIGVASVLLGLTFAIGANCSVAHADELGQDESQAQSTTTENQQAQAKTVTVNDAQGTNSSLSPKPVSYKLVPNRYIYVRVPYRDETPSGQPQPINVPEPSATNQYYTLRSNPLLPNHYTYATAPNRPEAHVEPPTVTTYLYFPVLPITPNTYLYELIPGHHGAIPEGPSTSDIQNGQQTPTGSIDITIPTNPDTPNTPDTLDKPDLPGTRDTPDKHDLPGARDNGRTLNTPGQSNGVRRNGSHVSLVTTANNRAVADKTSVVSASKTAVGTLPQTGNNESGLPCLALASILAAFGLAPRRKHEK